MKCRACGLEFNPLNFFQLSHMPSISQGFSFELNEALYQSVDLKICDCPACGLVQLDNQPVSYFKKVIRATSVSPEMVAYRKCQLESFLTKYNLWCSPGIEVGCGTGDYLSILSSLNHKIEGLEEDSYSHDYAKEMIVNNGYLLEKQNALESNKYQHFYIFSFIEHWSSLQKSFTELRRILRKGAVGIIEVPNFDMILKSAQVNEFVIDHLTYFTNETLKRVLEINGFDVIHIKSIWHEYILSAEVKLRDPLDLSIFSNSLTSFEISVDDLLRSHDRRLLVFWGAGHQALATLALSSGLQNAVNYIVDSAPHKQNKFAPCSGKKIISPEALEDLEECNMVLAAGSYNSELQQKCSQLKNIHNIYILDHGIIKRI